MMDTQEQMMMTKFDHWKNVCKIHWREIITMSIALHWVVDLLILGPNCVPLGVLFGLHIDGGQPWIIGEK